jgi:hypothetical protein
MKLGSVLALCIVSAAIGAGIDHYWGVLAPSLRPGQSESVQATPAPAQQKDTEVLGDRVRCDVRFGELHLPDSAYRSFLDRCMGTPAGAAKDGQ